MHSVFMGVHIYHADRNASGIRYTALVKGRNLRADTLAGIKDLIRAERAAWGAYWNAGA